MRHLDRATVAVMSFATFVSLGIRLAVVMRAGFPLNDGGLFYAMTADLLSNQLRLPILTSYNAASIPFAYPPFAFYFYAILNLITHVSLLHLIQYGPPVISCASIPAFYFLAQDLLGSKTQAALAMLVFSLLPRTFDWLIMGGGVTRSFGMLFSILAMRQAYLLFGNRSSKAIGPMIILGSLVVYSHPEAATHTAISAALFYLWKDRSRKGLTNGLLVAAGILTLTFPWWGTVLARHGADPFLAVAAAARQDSYNTLVGLLVLFRFDFADEPFVAVLTVIGLVGIFLQLVKRQYLLPLWMLAMHTLEPRGGPLFMMIPLALCAGIGLDQVFLPPLDAQGTERVLTATPEPDGRSSWLDQLFHTRAVRLFLGFVLVYGIMSAYEIGWRIQQNLTLTEPDLQAFDWVRTNTGTNSRFALVTQELPLRDATSEWFPAVTGRQSIATVFGFEWLKDEDFLERIERYQSLQACAPRGAECLEDWSQKNKAAFDYLYIRNPGGIGSVALATFLVNSAEYQAVYYSQTVEIFKLK